MYRPFSRGSDRTRGRMMHTTRPGAFLMALLRRVRPSTCPGEMFSYLAGFLCHYALDSSTHPYIIWFTTKEQVFPRSHMSLEHALDAVEMKLAYLEDFTAKLQEVAVEQGKTIDILREENKLLSSRLRDLIDNLEEIPNRKPPHY